jgi:hypothetical protein
MLRRVNSALFEAPPGARIQVVAEAQGNNGVNDARFEYAGQILPRETILGLPGCSFTVAGPGQRLEAGVVFDPGASGGARYDLFEVENSVKSNLNKSVRSSDGSLLISFAIDPVAVAADAPMADAPPAVAPTKAARRPTARKAAAKKAAKKKGRATKKTAKRTVRKTAKKTAGRRRTTATRKTSRKPPK